MSVVLKNAVRRALRAPGRSDVDRRRRTGKLDRRALVRARCARPDVFAKKAYTDAEVAGVEILIDCSGSMDYYKFMTPALKMAEELSSAIDAAGVPFEVHGYGDPEIGPNGNYTGNPGCTLLCVKPFNKTWQACSKKLMRLSRFTRNTTHIMPALLAAGERLLQRGNINRRIVFILTDGEDDYGPDAAKVASELLAKRGVTVCAIGVQCDVSHIVTNVKYAANNVTPKTLATGGLRLLLDTLARDAKE
jgi:hypothetical protein